MDGISSVLQRVHGIEDRLRALQATPAPVISHPGSQVAPASSSAGTFDSILAATSAAPADSGTAAALVVPAAPVIRGPLSKPHPTGTAAGVSSATSPQAAEVTAAGSPRDARGVPLELLRYGNGKVPASALSPAGQGQHRLWAPAVRAVHALRAAAAEAGVKIRISDSYRSYDEQVDLAQRKGLYSQGGLAAVPGTSDHGWGLSLDLNLDGEALSWMRDHAKEYGFSENVAREPWHWTYTG